MDHFPRSLETDAGRPVAPGGARRAVLGALVGVVVGVIAVLTSRRPGS